MLILSFALLATGDSETPDTDASEPKEATSTEEKTKSPQDVPKDVKLAKPPAKESGKSEVNPLERLVLDEEVESAANISLPQDI